MADVKDLKVNGTKYNIKIPSANVKLMTGYSKGSSTDAITPSDSLNSAIGKLECRADRDQTNIWYAIDTGVKNWFVVPDGTYSSNSASNSSVCLVENGAVKIITCTTGETRTMTLGTITIPAGTYKLSNFVLGGSSNYGDVRLMNPDGSRLSPSSDGVFTIAAETIATVKVYTWNASALNASVSPLLCVKSIYDQDSSYAKPALPNYDLTRLEAEDRAALAEEIDAGAKNILKYDMAQLATLNPTWTVSGNTIRPSSDTHITFTLNSDMSIRVQSDGSNAQAELCLCTSNYSSLKAGTYVLSGCPTGGNSSTTYDIRLIEQSSPKKYNVDIGSASGYKITWSAQYTYTCNIMVRANQNIDKTFKPMLCTKAAFDVSQKFVPYRVPITGLTAVNRSIACSTTETSTGIKFVATKTAMYKITVTAHYGASKPLILRIKQKVNASASTYPFIVVKSTDDSIALTATGIMTLGVGGEFEIFATYASAANNNIYMLVEELG